MKRIVITGAKGLLGEACCRLLKDKYEVISLARSDVDLTDARKLSDVLSGLDFDFLINNAAMSGLEECFSQPEKAVQVNTDAPRVMAQICDQKNAKMLQVSTDYVLNGQENIIHDEASVTQESGIYSKTKLAAEQVVMEECADSVVGRVSWLFGYGRETFVDQVVNTALKGERASYIVDKFSIPNFSDYLVPAMGDLLESDFKGVIHLTNGAQPESWYSYANKIIEVAKDLDILKGSFDLIDQSYLDQITFFKQLRPRHTAMRPKRLAEELNIRVGNWEYGVREYLLQKHGNSLTNQ